MSPAVPSTRRRPFRRSGGDVVVNANLRHFRSRAFRFFRRKIEIQDVTRIVAIQIDDAIALTQSLRGRLDRHRIGSRKDCPSDRGVGQPRPYRPKKKRFMAAPSANDKSNFPVSVATIQESKMAFHPLQGNWANRQKSLNDRFNCFVRPNEELSHIKLDRQRKVRWMLLQGCMPFLKPPGHQGSLFLRRAALESRRGQAVARRKRAFDIRPRISLRSELRC